MKLFKPPVFIFLYIGSVLCSCTSSPTTKKAGVLFQHVRVINGISDQPIEDADVWVLGDSIVAIEKGIDTNKVEEVISLNGKTIMPALISTHVHIGTLKGTTTSGSNYTRANILSQLKKYEKYGVLTVQCMGTDRPLLFKNKWYDSLRIGLIDGARLYSAGYGFGVPAGAPPASMGMDKLYRPDSTAEISHDLDVLSDLGIQIVKIWVDDFGGNAPKMKESIYHKIIEEAHKRSMRVASHLYYLSDAHQLADDGVDIFAHSIRDRQVDQKLIARMQEQGIAYIPTLTLDEYSFSYVDTPAWIQQSFFKNSLEPGVYELIKSASFKKAQAEPEVYIRNKAGLETALENVKKLYDEGILIGLGTDSGAQPVRTQGYSEHRELQLLVMAGLTPMEAIQIGTLNSAKVLHIDAQYGSLESGKKADFIVLSANPLDDIQNTEKIEAVYKSGHKVSDGPQARN